MSSNAREGVNTNERSVMDKYTRRQWNAAQKVPAQDYERPVYYEGRYYDSVDELVEAFGGIPPRSGVFGSGREFFGLETANIVDELVMHEFAPEDYVPEEKTVKFIDDFVEMFNQIYGQWLDVEDRGIGVVFDEVEL